MYKVIKDKIRNQKHTAKNAKLWKKAKLKEYLAEFLKLKNSQSNWKLLNQSNSRLGSEKNNELSMRPWGRTQNAAQRDKLLLLPISLRI